MYTLNITCVYLQDNDASLTQVKFSRSATSFVNEQGVEAFPDENVLDLVVTYQVPLYPLGSAIFAALSSGQLLADFQHVLDCDITGMFCHCFPKNLLLNFTLFNAYKFFVKINDH